METCPFSVPQFLHLYNGEYLQHEVIVSEYRVGYKVSTTCVRLDGDDDAGGLGTSRHGRKCPGHSVRGQAPGTWD